MDELRSDVIENGNNCRNPEISEGDDCPVFNALLTEKLRINDQSGIEQHSQKKKTEASKKAEERKYHNTSLEISGKFLHYENYIDTLANENEEMSIDLRKAISIIKEQKQELSLMYNELLTKFNTKIPEEEAEKLKEINKFLKIEYEKLEERLKDITTEFNQVGDGFLKSCNTVESEIENEDLENERITPKMEIPDHMIQLMSERKKYELIIEEMENIRDKDISGRMTRENIIYILKIKATLMKITLNTEKLKMLKIIILEYQNASDNLKKNYKETQLKFDDEINTLKAKILDLEEQKALNKIRIAFQEYKLMHENKMDILNKIIYATKSELFHILQQREALLQEFEDRQKKMEVKPKKL